MNLLEIRTQFVKISGRNDLVVDTSAYADNGANYYINAGQKMLDMKFRFPKDVGMYPSTLAVNGYSILIPYCRSVKEVWVADTDGRRQLKKLSYQDFLTKYTENFATAEAGDAEYYCPAMLRAIPENAVPSAITAGWMPTLAGTSYEYNAILIGSPTDVSLYTEVYGLFYTNELTSDTMTSYWATVHPEILVRAALYQLDIDSRDTTSAKNWLGAVESSALDIDKDSVEEEMSEVDQMEG